MLWRKSKAGKGRRKCPGVLGRGLQCHPTELGKPVRKVKAEHRPEGKLWIHLDRILREVK